MGIDSFSAVFLRCIFEKILVWCIAIALSAQDERR